MGVREIGRNEGYGEVPQQKQSKIEKKSTTFEQRRAKYMRFAVTGLTLLGVGAIRGACAESSNQAKQVAENMQLSVYQNQVEGHVPSLQQMQDAQRWYEEKGLPFGPVSEEAQGASREGTSQAKKDLSNSQEARGLSMKKKVRVDIHSGKKTASAETSQSTIEAPQAEQGKGKGYPMSSKEQIATLRAAIEELQTNPNPNPVLIEHARKLLTESRRQPSEQEGGSERRRLNVPPNPLCLDVSQSGGYSEVQKLKQLPGDGTERVFDVLPIVQNNCNEQADHVTFVVQAKMHCPEQYWPWWPGGTEGIDNKQYTRDGKDENLSKKQTTGADKGLEDYAVCGTYDGPILFTNDPDQLTATVTAYAIGHDSNKNLQSPPVTIDLLKGGTT
jgi:hypothetical protein